MYGMVKTTIYLPEKLRASLKRRAEEENRSEAEIIREAIRKAVAVRRRVRPRIPLSVEGLGDSTIADKVDELLLDFGNDWTNTMLLLDTSGLIAALFPDQRAHRLCAQVLKNADPPLLLSPFVLAEVDYLINKFAGIQTEKRLLEDIEREAYRLEAFSEADIGEALTVINRYEDLGIGLADSSIVVLSRRHRTTQLLTLDERHFRVLTGPSDRSFRILPADLAGWFGAGA
jgi:predicted nucleic acid-binding protein